jgi:hypothetical protein
VEPNHHSFIAWCLIKHRDNFGVKGICVFVPIILILNPGEQVRNPVFTAAVFGKVVTFANERGII